MEIRPILSALMRSKVSMILIGLQVALTLAIVCNALFIISQRLTSWTGFRMNEVILPWFSSIARRGLRRFRRAESRSRPSCAVGPARRRCLADEHPCR